MKKILFYGFLITMLGIFCLSSLAYAETEVETITNDSSVQVDENTEDVDEIITEDKLEDMYIEEITKVPSSFGLWWRGIRERISIGLTLDPVKKAEKQLKYAEERMRIAEVIAEKSEDPKIQERATEMVKRAQDLMVKVEARKDKLLENKGERVERLFKNIATHNIRREQVMDKLEDKLKGKISEEKMEKLRALREKGLESGKRLLNAINTKDLPERVHKYLQNVKDKIKIRATEVKKYRNERRKLKEAVKEGDESAVEELKQLNQKRKKQLHTRVENFKNRIHNFREDAKTGVEGAIKKLRVMDRVEDVRDKVEDVLDRREDVFDTSGKDMKICVNRCVEKGTERDKCRVQCKRADIREDVRDKQEDIRDRREDAYDSAHGVTPKSIPAKKVIKKVQQLKKKIKIHKNLKPQSNEVFSSEGQDVENNDQ